MRLDRSASNVGAKPLDGSILLSINFHPARGPVKREVGLQLHRVWDAVVSPNGPPVMTTSPPSTTVARPESMRNAIPR